MIGDQLILLAFLSPASTSCLSSVLFRWIFRHLWETLTVAVPSTFVSLACGNSTTATSGQAAIRRTRWHKVSKAVGTEPGVHSGERRAPRSHNHKAKLAATWPAFRPVFTAMLQAGSDQGLSHEGLSLSHLHESSRVTAYACYYANNDISCLRDLRDLRLDINLKPYAACIQYVIRLVQALVEGNLPQSCNWTDASPPFYAAECVALSGLIVASSPRAPTLASKS